MGLEIINLALFLEGLGLSPDVWFEERRGQVFRQLRIKSSKRENFKSA
jgi:hypothetical protein